LGAGVEIGRSWVMRGALGEGRMAARFDML
jgi:hypothetical protein